MVCRILEGGSCDIYEHTVDTRIYSSTGFPVQNSLF